MKKLAIVLLLCLVVLMSASVAMADTGQTEILFEDDIFSYEQWLTDTQFIPGQSETNCVRVRFIPPGGDTVVTIVVYPLL